MADRFNKVAATIWGDQTFRTLSKIRPSGQGLWLYILTGPHQVGLPGLVSTGLLSLADGLRWDITDAEAAFDELVEAKLLTYDPLARVIFLPRGIEHNPPASGKNLVAWRRRWDLVPESFLRTRWLRALTVHCGARGWDRITGFEDVIEDRIRDGEPHPMPDAMPDAMPDPMPPDPDADPDTESEGPVITVPPVRDIMDPKTKKAAREQQCLVQVQAWIDQLQTLVEADAPGLVEMVVGEFASQVEANKAKANRSFTAIQRATFATRMQRSKPLHQLYGLEVFVDQCTGTQDERYACAIAEQKRHLTDEEFDREHDAHRRKNPSGFWSRYLAQLRQAANERNTR